MIAHRTAEVEGLHMLDTGHFAVEDSLGEIVAHIERFYDTRVAAQANGQVAVGAR